MRVTDLSIDEGRMGYAHVNIAVTLLFCGYVITWYLQLGERHPSLSSIRFEFVYASLLALIALFHFPSIDRKCPLYTYVLLYLVVLLIQLPLSLDFETSWTIFIDRIVKFSFLGLFIVVFVRSPTHLKYFICAVFIAFLKMGQEGLLGKITGGMMWQNQGIMRLHGVTSLYTQPNSYAGMAVGTLPFVLYFWSVSGRLVRTVLAVQAFLALNIIVFSGSRTGYVGLLGILVFLFFVTKAKKKFVVYTAALAVAAVVFVPGQYFERFDTIYTMEEKEGASSATRIEILKDAVEIFASHPFGVGIQAFPAVRKTTFGREQDTHNLYLEVATNLGIQGLFVFGLLIFKLLQTLRASEKEIVRQIGLLREKLAEVVGDSSHDPAGGIVAHIKDLELVVACARGLFLFVIVRLILGVFGMDLYEIYWWFAIGLTIAIFNIGRAAEEKTSVLCGQSHAS
jgi:O-antigen ligase